MKRYTFEEFLISSLAFFFFFPHTEDPPQMPVTEGCCERPAPRWLFIQVLLSALAQGRRPRGPSITAPSSLQDP